jgi:hypothetical protein
MKRERNKAMTPQPITPQKEWGEAYIKLTDASHAWWLFAKRRRLQHLSGQLAVKSYPVKAITYDGDIVVLSLTGDNWVSLTRQEYNRAMSHMGMEGIAT